jgi:hypothetical protein
VDHVPNDAPESMAEAGDPETNQERLAELMHSEDEAVARLAAARFFAKALEVQVRRALSDARDPDSQTIQSFGLLLEAFRLVPGRIAALDHDSARRFLEQGGWGDDAELLSLIIDAVLACRGPLVEKVARDLATKDWHLSLWELLEAATILARKQDN